MSTHAHYSVRESFGPADDFAYDDDQPHAFELTAEDRIGPPPLSRAARLLRRLAHATFVIGIGAAGGWALQTWPDLPARIQLQVAEVIAAMTRQPVITEEATGSAAVAPPVSIAPLPPEPVAAMNQPAPPVPATDETAAAQGATPIAEPPERLPPPKPDPADPNQKRAVAAGLHPGLSPALLARLTDADYRNAGIAVKTALTETPEDGELVWPREPKANLARFQVRFVRGAGSECRRYVVAVLKDGWKTTALPMEKCKS